MKIKKYAYSEATYRYKGYIINKSCYFSPKTIEYGEYMWHVYCNNINAFFESVREAKEWLNRHAA